MSRPFAARSSYRCALAGIALMSTVLSGCGEAPWESGSATPGPTAESSPGSATPTGTPSSTGGTSPSATTPSPSPTTSATATARNDLAQGSARRTVQAGAIELKVNYWSTLPMQEWTAEAAKPLNLSASATFTDDSKQDIFLSKVTLVMAVEGPDGPLEAPKSLVDEASVSPGYAVRRPVSYQQVFTIPALPEDATSVTVTVNYELLAQTAPKAKTYAKQTASDVLVVALG